MARNRRRVTDRLREVDGDATRGERFPYSLAGTVSHSGASAFDVNSSCTNEFLQVHPLEAEFATTPLAGGLDLQVIQRVGDWARVVAVNGWSGWVDARLLVPRQ
jgi:hypothetical protein